MRTRSEPTFVGFVCVLLGSSAILRAASGVDPATFDANGDKRLDEDELIRYVIARDKLRPDVAQYLDSDLQFIAKEGPKSLQEAVAKSLRDQAGFAVGEIIGNLGEKTAYTYEEIRRYDGIHEAPDGSLTQIDPREAPALPGIWKESKTTKEYSYGPVQLRKNRDERMKDDLDSVSGATLSLANNQVDSTKTRSSEGALIYPINRLTSSGEQGRLTLSPSVGWKFARISDSGDQLDADEGTPGDPRAGEADEVRFDLGIAYTVLFPKGELLHRASWELSPFLITDSKFRGLIGGAQVEFTPYLQQNGFAVNMGYKGPLAGTPFRYRIAFIPLLDLNRLYYESRFIDRDNTDSHLGVGARAEIGIKTNGFPSLEALLTYKFLQGLDDSEQHSDLFTAALKLWFTENAGLSFERQKGETPVAEKEVDLTTLGFEVKF